MSNYITLKRTIEQVISQSENDFIERINSSYNDALNRLRASRGLLENEYNKIIEDAKKQAESLKRQIVGSSSINARNKQLIVIENAINNVFNEVMKRIDKIRDSNEYNLLLSELLEDAIKVINTDMIIECNKEDITTITNILPTLSYPFNITVSEKPIDILGGLRARSIDGSIVYENTLERKIERLKPLIKKDIVGLFVK